MWATISEPSCSDGERCLCVCVCLLVFKLARNWLTRLSWPTSGNQLLVDGHCCWCGSKCEIVGNSWITHILHTLQLLLLNVGYRVLWIMVYKTLHNIQYILLLCLQCVKGNQQNCIAITISGRLRLHIFTLYPAILSYKNHKNMVHYPDVHV